MNLPPKISMAAARVNAKKTQEDVAIYLGVSKTTVVNYENGRTTPDWDTVKKLESFYRYPFDFVHI